MKMTKITKDQIAREGIVGAGIGALGVVAMGATWMIKNNKTIALGVGIATGAALMIADNKLIKKERELRKEYAIASDEYDMILRKYGKGHEIEIAAMRRLKEIGDRLNGFTE